MMSLSSKSGIKVKHTGPPPFRTQQDLHLAQEKTEHSRCPNCGEEINKLLFAVVDSDYIIEEYYGYPHCLAKIKDIEEKKTHEAPKNEILKDFEFSSKIGEPEVTLSEEEDEEEPMEAKVTENKPKPASCIHYAGYLKNRPKNTSVPDECLTCSEMIDCMM